MSARSAKPQPASPLDGFLDRFLRGLEQLPDGFSPIADAERIADACSLTPAFVDALFVSARTRGLIEPFRSRSAKGRYRWKVSGRGKGWLSAREGERTA